MAESLTKNQTCSAASVVVPFFFLLLPKQNSFTLFRLPFAFVIERSSQRDPLFVVLLRSDFLFRMKEIMRNKTFDDIIH